MSMPGETLTNLIKQLDQRLSWSHRISLMVIILLGFLLRWYSLYEGHAFILVTIRDEVMAIKFALAFLAGDPNTWYIGQPALNQGNIPGPLWTMLVAAFYKLGGNSAEGAMFWIMVLNSLVIYLVYLFATRLLAARYALLTALFYALSPWPIYYAAGLYNPMILALLGVLLFWALWQTINVERSRAIFWVMLLAAMVLQFHMIGIFYYPLILLLLWITPCRLNLPWLSAGIVAGVLLYVPYFIGEITHHWANLHGVLHGGNKFSFGIFKILTIPPEMLTNHPGGWLGISTAEFKDFGNRFFGSYLVLLFLNLISFGLALAFVYGFIRKFYSLLRDAQFNFRTALENNRLYVFLGVLLVLPLLLYMLTGKAYASRYSIFIFPLLFLLPALYLERIAKARIKRIVLYSLAAMFICNVYLVLVFYADQNRKLTTADQYMPAFYKLKALYSALRRDAGPDKTIVLDTRRYTIVGNKYSEIATDAISNYIDAYETHRAPSATPRQPRHYVLVDALAKVPAKASIVFRDNGAVIYTP